jgi:hypothetical protein
MDKKGINHIRRKFNRQYPLPIETAENDCQLNIKSPFFPAYCREICRNPSGYQRCVEMRARALETARQTGRENIFL